LLSSSIPLGVPIAVFGLGVVSTVAAILANRTQHGYYRNVRDAKRTLEDRLGLGDLALATTPGMGGRHWRLARVATFQTLILSALLAADLVGLVAGVREAVKSPAAPTIELAMRVVVKRGASIRSFPLVLVRAGKIEAGATPRPGELVLLRVRPGRYTLSALTPSPCSAAAVVTKAPLQSLVVRCP
jgi:hypothetical protein